MNALVKGILGGGTSEIRTRSPSPPVLTNLGNPLTAMDRNISFLQLERYRENCSWHSHTGTSDKFPSKARYSFQKTLIDMWRRMRYRHMSDNFENCLVKLY